MMKNTRALSYFGIFTGSLVMAFSVPAFVTGSKMIPGGVTGAAELLHRLFALPVGAGIFLLCLTIFLFGYRLLGRQSAIRALVCFTLYSLMTDVLAHFVPHLTRTGLGSAVGVGLTLGTGLGLALSCGGSLGTTDLIGKMIGKYYPVPVGVTIMVLDTLPVVVGAALFGGQTFFCSVLSIALVSISVEVSERFFTRLLGPLTAGDAHTSGTGKA